VCDVATRVSVACLVLAGGRRRTSRRTRRGTMRTIQEVPLLSLFLRYFAQVLALICTYCRCLCETIRRASATRAQTHTHTHIHTDTHTIREQYQRRNSPCCVVVVASFAAPSSLPSPFLFYCAMRLYGVCLAFAPHSPPRCPNVYCLFFYLSVFFFFGAFCSFLTPVCRYRTCDPTRARRRTI
jgi:hypothetical protein